MTTRQEVYNAIDSEREYQEAMWGDSLSNERAPDPAKEESGGDHTLDEFTLYISGYTNELVQMASHFVGAEEQLAIIRKIAGLSVACMEQHGAPKRKMPDELRNRHASIMMLNNR